MTETYKKKLIEVAIPLEAINAASAREKSIRHGHPSTLHLWWARRPLAACRAVLFAQLVDDPSSHPDKFPTEESVEAERKRLFNIIEELVKWENSTNEEVLEKARKEIRNSCDGELPPVYDPFSGGGAIPLEAQRLGLPAYGSDLNPVAVTIGKSMLELPWKFKDLPPVNRSIRSQSIFRFSEGLSEDVRYYSEIVRKLAVEKIGDIFPKAQLAASSGNKSATVIAWIWARTVPSPDPAYSDVNVPLISTFVLSSKKGSEAYIKPEVDKGNKIIRYKVANGGTKEELEIAVAGTKVGRGANFKCLMSDAAITPRYVKEMGKKGAIGKQLIAIVAENNRQRSYIAPTKQHDEAANVPPPDYIPSMQLPNHSQYIGVLGYGFKTFGDLFTNRQLLALNTFSDIVAGLREEVFQDALAAGLADDDTPLSEGGIGARAYAEAVSIYLSFIVDKCADYWSSVCTWHNSRQTIRNTFGRQAIPMAWDFAEVNPFSASTGNWTSMSDWVWKSIAHFRPRNVAEEVQHDAQSINYPSNAVISTDPPYYDNIPYADLSDFFFAWLKRSVGDVYPSLFSVLAVPKMEELVADRVRHKTTSGAEEFFLTGMKSAMSRMAKIDGASAPATIYYAFKQSEIGEEGVSSTGWATFLEAVITSGFSVVATWPVRTELANRMRGNGANALANSVVMVCRRKNDQRPAITRAEFVRNLKRELPATIRNLQSANVSPADMPQSAIGPGIGIFSRYKEVLEANDQPMSVKTALQLINVELDEFLNNLHGDFDSETRFAATWFEQNGYGKGEYGSANSLATARGIAVDSVKHAGIIESSAGKVRILKRDELDPEWDPNSDTHLTIWECCQYLVKEYEEGGETAAAMLVKKMGFDRAEAVKDLAYYLYDICSNKRQDAKEATSYNALIAGWLDITRLAASIHDTDTKRQANLDL